VSKKTFDTRMERILRTLPPALRGMGFGDPDDVEYAPASDVVAWAIKEIDRLREERKIWCTVDGYPGKFEAQPLPPGPDNKEVRDVPIQK